ncbi:MAG: hypothetical protein IJ946_04955 [Clostridia bacterium]|nr:hypothetical protein [Clostridia bacterium]
MKCNNCSFEHEQPFTFCPACGADNRYVAPVNPVFERLLSLLQDKKFLTLCILLTVSCGLSLFGGSIQLLNILIAIFLWIAYNNGKKGVLEHKQLKNVSGTVYAMYIINYVAFSLFIVLGLIFALIFTLISGVSEVQNEFINGFYEGLRVSGMEVHEFEQILSQIGITMREILPLFGWIFFIVFTITGVFGIIFNAIGLSKIRRFAKSVCISAESGTWAIEKAKGAKTWLIVFAVFGGISALTNLSGNFLAAAGAGVEVATMILAVILIKKYFINENED